MNDFWDVHPHPLVTLSCDFSIEGGRHPVVGDAHEGAHVVPTNLVQIQRGPSVFVHCKSQSAYVSKLIIHWFRTSPFVPAFSDDEWLAVFPPPGDEWSRLPGRLAVEGGVVLLGPDNTLPLVPGNRRLARAVIPEGGFQVLGEKKNQPAHQLLRRLVSQGKAAGNTGDLV